MNINICNDIRQQDPNFIFGAATSNLQIEGNSNRGISIWDETLKNYPTCDHEIHYKEDINMVKNMGLNAYRCSISWSRIMPDGRKINKDGINFYKNLFQYASDLGIELWVTLYHWDLPLVLQEEFGGWVSPEIIPLFVNYANICFEYFDDLINNWITFNEPYVFCHYGYGIAQCPPGLTSKQFEAAHNILLAHKEVYKMYKNYSSNKKGNIGITLNCAWREPYSLSDEDIKATKYAMESRFDWFALPITEGKYPDILFDKIKNLPNEGKFDGPLGTDFIGINYYTSKNVKAHGDTYVDMLPHSSIKTNSMGWAVIPEGLGKLLKYANNLFPNKPIYITENGFSDEGTLDDFDRINYIEKHLLQIKNSIIEDKIPLKGIFWWSLMDNIEWGRGIEPHFGLIHVDFNTPDKIRTPKASYNWIKKQLS